MPPAKGDTVHVELWKGSECHHVCQVEGIKRAIQGIINSAFGFRDFDNFYFVQETIRSATKPYLMGKPSKAVSNMGR